MTGFSTTAIAGSVGPHTCLDKGTGMCHGCDRGHSTWLIAARLLSHRRRVTVLRFEGSNIRPNPARASYFPARTIFPRRSARARATVAMALYRPGGPR
jgi:hypothetical protein